MVTDQILEERGGFSVIRGILAASVQMENKKRGWGGVISRKRDFKV